MSASREIVREKARVARDLIKSTPLTPELSAKLFAQKGIGAFRFSAALNEWSQSELESPQKIWVQAYKNAWHVPWSTTNSLYTFLTAEGRTGPRGVFYKASATNSNVPSFSSSGVCETVMSADSVNASTRR